MSDSKFLGCQIIVSCIIAVISFAVILKEKGYLVEFFSVVTLVIILLCTLHYRSEYKKQLEENKKERQSSINERIRLNNNIKSKEEELANKSEIISEQLYEINTLYKTLYSDDVFKTVSELRADIDVILYKEKEHELKIKKRPAYKAAELVKQLREKSREHIAAYKDMKYRYEFLLKSFPEIGKYVDEYEALKKLAECKAYVEIEEGIDRVSDFISKDEWDKLSINERNQLALDRYKERSKSNWAIGIEYEMYIDYLLRSNGYSTYHYGILKGLNDLGRDIIAKKNGQHFIIQCKNWSKNKEIHENVVCQLFGTALEYKIENQEKMPNWDWDRKVTPVLYSTTKLSDTAMKFADKLGVVVIIKEIGEYPMIKCNIGKSGEKIYHLPFDQQYYNTIIFEEGEFYAWTVKEAVDAGFRRAYRYTGYGSII